jgi:flavin reductase (DIM6/NTAB) family NADH-FMN oxidoreductase RutF
MTPRPSYRAGSSHTGAEEDLIQRVRMAHRQFPTGVTVVTTMAGEVPVGLTVNAFTSLSLSPPEVLVCVARTSATHEHLAEESHAAINILSDSQRETAAIFARTGVDKFDGLVWRHGRFGAPVLAGVSAVFEVWLKQHIPAATHSVFIANVLHAEASAAPPLLYFAGEFFDGPRVPGRVPDSRNSGDLTHT